MQQQIAEQVPWRVIGWPCVDADAATPLLCGLVDRRQAAAVRIRKQAPDTKCRQCLPTRRKIVAART